MQQQRARMEARRARRKKKKAGPPTPSTSRIGKLTDPMALRRAAAERRQEMKAEQQKKAEAKKTKPKAVTPEPAAKKLVKSITPKPAQPSAQANKGSGRDGKLGTGTYGKSRPSDKKKNQSKSKTKQQGGLRSRSRRRAGSGTNVNVREALSNFAKTVDEKLKLTHKKGDTKKVGRDTYRWNGKRWQKISTPF